MICHNRWVLINIKADEMSILIWKALGMKIDIDFFLKLYKNGRRACYADQHYVCVY